MDKKLICLICSVMLLNSDHKRRDSSLDGRRR